MGEVVKSIAGNGLRRIEIWVLNGIGSLARENKGCLGNGKPLRPGNKKSLEDGGHYGIYSRNNRS